MKMCLISGLGAILFEDNCFMVKEMVYLVEIKQYFLDDANLSDALPLNLGKSLIAQTSYFKEVISMVANNLTSSLNLEIEVKLLLQGDGTTAASLLLFVFPELHFKESGKSGTKEALQFVAETEQQCGTVNAVRQYLWLFEEFPLKVVHAYVDSFNFRGSGHVVLIVQRHHFASYLEREWQCSTYDIQVENVLIGAYDKTGTMTTNQMAVAKLVALRPRPIILLKFRVDGITYNPLDGEILNWPTGKMDANLQMIAKVADVCNNASITQAKQKCVAHGMPTEADAKCLVEKMVLSKESNGAQSSNGRVFLGCCQKWSEFERRIATLEFDRDKKSTGVIVNSVSGKKSLLVKGVVDNLLEKSTKVQLLDGTVVPLDDSSRNYIVQALHEMSTSALKPLNDAPVLKLADIGIAMGISGIENISIRRECAAAFKQVPTSKFFSLVDKANFQGGTIVMNPICN